MVTVAAMFPDLGTGRSEVWEHSCHRNHPGVGWQRGFCAVFNQMLRSPINWPLSGPAARLTSRRLRLHRFRRLLAPALPPALGTLELAAWAVQQTKAVDLPATSLMGLVASQRGLGFARRGLLAAGQSTLDLPNGSNYRSSIPAPFRPSGLQATFRRKYARAALGKERRARPDSRGWAPTRPRSTSCTSCRTASASEFRRHVSPTHAAAGSLSRAARPLPSRGWQRL